MVDADHVDQGPNVLGIGQRRVGQMGPDTNDAPRVGDDFRLLLANEPGPHHAGHVQVLAQLGIESGVGDEYGMDRHFQRRGERLRIGVRQVDENAQPVTFLDNVRPEGGQPHRAGFVNTSPNGTAASWSWSRPRWRRPRS